MTGTERHVFEALFGTNGLLLHKTVILVTNDTSRLPAADHIIELSGNTGRIGTSSNVLSRQTVNPVVAPLPSYIDEKEVGQDKSKDLLDHVKVEDDQEMTYGKHVVWRAVWHHCQAAGLVWTGGKWILYVRLGCS